MPRARDAPVKLTPNSFMFRTVVEDTLYEAMYELYSKIVPSGCYVSVNRSEVQVKLKKEEPGTWPRLLKEKTKFPNIRINYDKFTGSSSEEDVSDEDNPFVLKKKKIKKFPKDMKKPKGAAVDVKYQESEEESEEEEDSEEAAMGFRTSLVDDYDPYDVFGMMS